MPVRHPQDSVQPGEVVEGVVEQHQVHRRVSLIVLFQNLQRFRHENVDSLGRLSSRPRNLTTSGVGSV